MNTKSDNPVYNDVKVHKIHSMHSPTTNYLVCYGYVDWKKDGNLKPAIYVLMEYKGYIKYDNPPHILTTKGDDGKSDLDKVLDAISSLRKEYGV